LIVTINKVTDMHMALSIDNFMQILKHLQLYQLGLKYMQYLKNIESFATSNLNMRIT